MASANQQSHQAKWLWRMLRGCTVCQETCLPGFLQCFDCAFTMLCLSTIGACSCMAEAPL